MFTHSEPRCRLSSPSYCARHLVPAFAAGGEVGNISGTIIDAQTKAPVANAQVGLAAPTGSFSAKTNSAGFFHDPRRDRRHVCVCRSAPQASTP